MSGEATFAPIVAPSFPIEDSREPRVLRNDFGDGYAERVGDGINIDRAMIEVGWENLTTSEMTSIWNTITGLKGRTAVLYQMPGFAETRKWIIPKYRRTFVEAGVWNISTSFEQVFDL